MPTMNRKQAIEFLQGKPIYTEIFDLGLLDDGTLVTMAEIELAFGPALVEIITSELATDPRRMH